MHSTLYRVVVILLCVSAIRMTASDAEGLVIGISAGAAVPDDKMSTAYDLVSTTDNPYALYEAATTLGLHVGARARMGLTKNLSLTGGIEINRFFDAEQRVTLQGGDVVALTSATDLIPVYAGLHYFLGRWIVAPYVSGAVSYTHRRVTVSAVGQNTTFKDLLLQQGIEVEPTASRFGARAAAGIAIELGPLHPFIEVGYTATNLVGRADNEPQRSFVHVAVGLTF